MSSRIIGGAEGFQSSKKARKARKKINEKRVKNTIDERKSIIIACEDSVSAPLYFNAIFDDLKKNHAIAAASLIIATHKHTDPCGVLKDLLAYPDYENFSYKWIVIDRDEERTNSGGHTLANFKMAMITAKTQKVDVAYSNPCFEIWYLLHSEYRNTAIDRDELIKKLEDSIAYSKNVLPDLKDLQDTAIKNANNLLQLWIDTQGINTPETNNPSTTVHKLVEVLNGLK
jgi:hypothetical protein